MAGAAILILAAISPAWGAVPSDPRAQNYSLEIFGNANMDGTIDDMDVAYVEGVIKGTNAPTNLSDANYDGKVDGKDIGQIRNIINKNDTELTYLNVFGKAETVKKPINRVAVMDRGAAEAFRILNSTDKIVAVTKSMMAERYKYFPEFSKTPLAGNNWNEPDFEAMLSQNPDAVITYIPQEVTWAGMKAQWESKLPGVKIITLGFVNPPAGNKWADRDRYNDLIQSTLTLGYILDKEKEAKEFCDWYMGIFDSIKSRTDKLSEDKKPKVYLEWSKDYYVDGTTRDIRSLDIAGGSSIYVNKSGLSTAIDPEMVMKENPDVIIGIYPFGYLDYETDNSSELIAKRDGILHRSELANISAIKDKRVYVQTYVMTNGPHTIINIANTAKILNPDLFKDLDTHKIHKEFLTRFQHLDFDLDKHGTFSYPPVGEV
jgi:iron complex transport system substrate-binding protein